MIFGLRFGKLAGKKASKKTVSDYKREMLVKLGHDQFKKLIDRGISIPVALL